MPVEKLYANPNPIASNQPEQNTVINFLYRDGANYKTANMFCFRGPITPEQIDRIIACLDGGEYFVPEKVGIEPERWGGYEYDSNTDHIWCELHKEDFIANADRPYDEDIDAETLVQRFEAVKGHWEDPNLTFDWILELPDELKS